MHQLSVLHPPPMSLYYLGMFDTRPPYKGEILEGSNALVDYLERMQHEKAARAQQRSEKKEPFVTRKTRPVKELQSKKNE